MPTWKFAGRKTAKYRQIGNAFPPPVAQAIGVPDQSSTRWRAIQAAPSNPGQLTAAFFSAFRLASSARMACGMFSGQAADFVKR